MYLNHNYYCCTCGKRNIAHCKPDLQLQILLLTFDDKSGTKKDIPGETLSSFTFHTTDISALSLDFIAIVRMAFFHMISDLS